MCWRLVLWRWHKLGCNRPKKHSFIFWHCHCSTGDKIKKEVGGKKILPYTSFFLSPSSWPTVVFPLVLWWLNSSSPLGERGVRGGLQSRAERGVEPASAVVWRWSEVKPANGQCSSIMRLCWPVRGPWRGAATLDRLPSDIGCLHTQQKQVLIGLKDKRSWHPQSAVKSLFEKGSGHLAVCRAEFLQERIVLWGWICFT